MICLSVSEIEGGSPERDGGEGAGLVLENSRSWISSPCAIWALQKGQPLLPERKAQLDGRNSFNLTLSSASLSRCHFVTESASEVAAVSISQHLFN